VGAAQKMSLIGGSKLVAEERVWSQFGCQRATKTNGKRGLFLGTVESHLAKIYSIKGLSISLNNFVQESK